MANEKRLIDANALMEWLWDTVDYHTWGECRYTADDIYNMLDDYPTVDAVEVVHGKWLINSDGYYPYCSNCMAEPKHGEMTSFCPNCGAKMDLRG